MFFDASIRLEAKIAHEKIKIPVHNHRVIPFHSPFNKVTFINIQKCIKQIEINKIKECFIDIPPNQSRLYHVLFLHKGIRLLLNFSKPTCGAISKWFVALVYPLVEQASSFGSSVCYLVLLYLRIIVTCYVKLEYFSFKIIFFNNVSRKLFYFFLVFSSNLS